MNGNAAVLIFRIGIVIALYGFLLQVVRTCWRELDWRRAPQAPRRAGACLEIVQPARTRLRHGQVIPLGSGITIGRDHGNDLVVDEDTVSGRHSRLITRDGLWWIEDLGSTNGTIVNEVPIGGARELGAGDLIQIGRVRLRFDS